MVRINADLSERILIMESHHGHSQHVSDGLERLVQDINTLARGGKSGLSHVVCGSSELAGFSQERVEYCGVDVADLVDGVPFEAVVWLLLTGELPGDEQLADAAAVMEESAGVEQSACEALSGLPLRTRPLELLPLAISMLSYFDPMPIDRNPAATRSRVWRILAQLPILLACGLGDESPQDSADTFVASRSTLAGAILQLVRGQDAARSQSSIHSSLEEDAMNVVLTCQCLTELRPACFAARFFGSTVSDVAPSVRSAASLYVAQMRNDPYEWIGSHLRSFHSPDHAEAWLAGRNDQLLPFGFTVEETDPRSSILLHTARQLLGSKDRIHIAACAQRLETLMDRRDRYPTMDWSASVVLTLLDVKPERMSLAIALARTVGWAAQAIDQNASGVTLMPQLHYAL